MKVKICGVTTLVDARAAAEAGADMIGFNFYKGSPRALTRDAARAIAVALRAAFAEATPLLVGVFVNENVSTISLTMDIVGLDAAQLSGDESVEMLHELRGIAFKAIRPRNEREARADADYFAAAASTDERLPTLLIDAYQQGVYGGTGERADSSLASVLTSLTPRLLLAGGLTPETIAERAAPVRPWGVDVASGVESGTPGVKDHDKMRAFVAAARRALA